MRIKTDYFALLRERAGKTGENIETQAATAGELYGELDRRYGFRLPAAQVRVAINDGFAGHESVLQDGDRVVFIVPVSGG